MSTDTTAVGASAAEATKAAKALFVDASPERLVAFLKSRPEIDDVELLDFRLVTEGAGASNGIALFSAAFTIGTDRQERDLVLRYMPGVQLLKQKTYRDEFLTVEAVHRAGLPVPRPLWLDDDGSLLGQPGYVMERVDGRSPDAGMYLSGLLAEATPEARKAMMLDAAGFHGRLRATAIGPALVPHLVDRGVGTTAVQRELSWWMAETKLVCRTDDHRRDYVRSIVDWMITNEPPLRPASLVHGDAQIANIMFKDAAIAGVVDWELSYLGHNEADLALIIFLTEAHKAQVPDIEGTPTASEYIERYEQESGAKVEHLEYFTLLNFVKILSIYLMMADKMPNFDALWDFHVQLVNSALADAKAILVG